MALTKRQKAARKAVATMRRKGILPPKGKHKKKGGSRSQVAQRAAKTRARKKRRYSPVGGKFRRKHAAQSAVRTMRREGTLGGRKAKRKKSGKKMPPEMLEYFRLLRSGVSKTAARKQAGLGPKKKKKKWGPGHPLYDWQQSHRK